MKKRFPACLFRSVLLGGVVGRATILRREANGAVTAEIELLPEHATLIEDITTTIYATEVVGERGEVWNVESARIREVFITTKGKVAW